MTHQEIAMKVLDKAVRQLEFTVIFYAVVALTTILVAVEWSSILSAWVSGIFSIRGVNLMYSLRKAHGIQKLVREDAKIE